MKPRGFTLIELLVVIAIITTLATLVFAGYRRAQMNARDNRRAQDLNQVKTALEQYFDLNLEYPTSNTGEIQCSGSGINWGAEWACDNHTYMRVLPEDPSGSPHPQYCYDSPGGGADFLLYTRVENDNNRNFPAPDESCNALDYNYKLENEK